MARTPRNSQGNLQDMANAPLEEAPSFLEADDAPTFERPPPMLPHPSPVVPLGVLGKNIVFLDGLQQIQIASTKCDKGDLMLWFGTGYLETHFEGTGKALDRWDQRKVQTALVEDCRTKGIFNPQGKVLGRGAHRPRADESQLVLHMGRRVLVSDPRRRALQLHPAGMVEIAGKDVFFPADDSLSPPADKPATKAEAKDLQDLFGKWSWADPAAPLLLFGWVAQAFIPGALEWRAHVWLPGPTAAGKSSLQKIIRAVLDDWVLSTADASEAAIRQMLRNDTLAVSIDEAEKHDNAERLQAVLNLMKKASSGDRILRGGADHKASEFTAQSCFLLSSVLHATLRGEDRNRIAMLHMRKLPSDVPPLEMELARWRSAGRRLHRRMIEAWPRFERTLAAYKREIGAQRFEGRWQDTYGTLLACADMLLYDHAPDDIVPDSDDPGIARVKAAVLTILPILASGRAEAQNDTDRAIAHLMSKTLPGEKGAAPETIGYWLERAMTLREQPGQFETDGSDFTVDEVARRKLTTHGLRVMQFVTKADASGAMKESCTDALTEETGWECGYLALAYPGHDGLQQLWQRTEWSGDGYKQSLSKIPGCRTWKVRFSGGKTDNALLVPLAAFRGGDE